MSKVVVGVIRGVSLKEIEYKKHNIFVGISLGNKWFTRENIKSEILWCLRYSKDKVGVLVADTLHAINYEVRNGYSKKRALRYALRKGGEMCLLIEEIISKLPKKEQKRVEIIRWDEVKENDFRKNVLLNLYKQFEKDPRFKQEIVSIVDNLIKRESRKFNTNQRLHLCRYVLEELPEFLQGLWIKRTYYDCHVYPKDDLLNQFVEKIQKKQIHPEIYPLLKGINTSIELKIK